MAAHRTAVRLGLLALLAGGLVPLGAAPVAATPGCTDETPPSLLADGCDDDTPPETTLTASATPNAAGLVAVADMTITLRAAVGDGDAGPFGIECRVVGTPQPHGWQSCPETVTLTGLPDARAGSYVVEARAVDLGDAGRTPDVLLGPGVAADTPDVDPTPATLTWGLDTRAPFVYVTGSGYDEATPTQPVVTGSSVPVRLNASEPATLECTDNDRPVPCAAGRWELRDPSAGRHVVAARAVDAAGNASAWSRPVEFFVPTDLTRARASRGWRTVRDAGHVGGDALRTTRRGARIVLPRTDVGELRLITPRGPGLGKVRVRVGRRDWHVVDLSGPRSALEQHVVLDRYSGMRTGRIVVEAVGRRPVVVDAVVARPNRFPPAQRGTHDGPPPREG